MQSPLEQFVIRPIIPIHVGGYDLSFTNSTLAMTIALAVVFVLFLAGTSRKALVPGRLQSVAEMAYEFVSGMVNDNTGHEGRKYIPFVFTVFLVVLLGNLLGLIPYNFTYTSHIIVTFALAIFIFALVVTLAVARHRHHFFALFLPHGVPVLLAPLVIPIEIISYVFRPISLSVRLFANMLAGHVMVQIFAGFAISLGLFGLSFGKLGILAGILPLALIVALVGLELIVAVLQAYVFAVLTAIYLRDTVEISH
jgi:F-type H+-transporting ATPase subunit a